MEATSNIQVRPTRRMALALAALASLPILLSWRASSPMANAQTAGNQTTYTVTDLGTLGGSFSAALSIDDRSLIVGESTLPGDTANGGFIWESGVITNLGSLPAGPTVLPLVANDSTVAVGVADGAASAHDANACFCPSPLNCHGFSWQNGIMTDLGTRGGASSGANWVNNRGQIAGVSQINAIDPNGNAFCGAGPGGQIINAYSVEEGTWTNIGTLGGNNAGAFQLNDLGEIAGASDTQKTVDPNLGFVPIHAFLYSNGSMVDLGTLGGGFSGPEFISNQGVIVGQSTLAGEQHILGFKWENGVLTNLGTLPGDSDSLAAAVNSVGQVVGFSATQPATGGAGLFMRGFIWKNGVMTDLNTLITSSSWQILVGTGINAMGEISAIALNNSTGQEHGVLLTPSNNSARGTPGGGTPSATLKKALRTKAGRWKIKILQ